MAGFSRRQTNMKARTVVGSVEKSLTINSGCGSELRIVCIYGGRVTSTEEDGEIKKSATSIRVKKSDEQRRKQKKNAFRTCFVRGVSLLVSS